MKKLSLFLVLLAACRSGTSEIPATTSPAPITAAPALPAGPRPAVESFLAAIRSQDVQALAGAWGDKNGAVRDSKVMSREDMEQREIVLMRCLRHDKYRVINEQMATDNERVVKAELTWGTQTRVVDFFTTQGPDRWFVRYAQPLCPGTK